MQRLRLANKFPFSQNPIEEQPTTMQSMPGVAL
jgi:hypothetical protein